MAGLSSLARGPWGYALASLPIALGAVDQLTDPANSMEQKIGGSVGTVGGGIAGGLLGGGIAGALSGGTLTPLGYAIGSWAGSSAGGALGNQAFAKDPIDREIEEASKVARAQLDMKLMAAQELLPLQALEDERLANMARREMALRAQTEGLSRYSSALFGAATAPYDPTPVMQLFG